MTMSKRYREWRLEQNIPILRFLLTFSAIAWAAIPFASEFTYPGDQPKVVYWLSLAINLPLCLGALMLIASPWRKHANLFQSVLMLVVSLDLSWMLAEVWKSPGGVTASGVWFALLCPFLRLPLKHVLCIAPPIVAATAVVLLQYFNLAPVQVWPELAFLLLALCLAIPFALMDEGWLSRAFKQEQLVAEQKAELERRQQQTEESRNLIRRYVPPAVAESIISGREADIAEPQRRRVTILFSDIVGFTDIADRVEPEVMTQVLSEYMSSMADLIESHGGTLNEFAGDGLMALFGAPEMMTPEDQARSAVTAAAAMQSKMPELNGRWRKLGLGAELRIRIGINTGMVSVGSYGSAGRMTYTAIGLQTNIASRIESKAESGEILISDATYQLISDSMPCEPRGEVECKGVHFPVRVYAPRSTTT